MWFAFKLGMRLSPKVGNGIGSMLFEIPRGSSNAREISILADADPSRCSAKHNRGHGGVIWQSGVGRQPGRVKAPVRPLPSFFEMPRTPVCWL